MEVRKMEAGGEEAESAQCRGFFRSTFWRKKKSFTKPRKKRNVEVWYWYVKAHKKNVTMLLTIPEFSLLTESLLLLTKQQELLLAETQSIENIGIYRLNWDDFVSCLFLVLILRRCRIFSVSTASFYLDSRKFQCRRFSKLQKKCSLVKSLKKMHVLTRALS